MVGMSAVGMFAVGMGSFAPVVYEPISKLGGASTFTHSPQRINTVDSIPWDDDSQILWDDDTAITWDE